MSLTVEPRDVIARALNDAIPGPEEARQIADRILSALAAAGFLVTAHEDLPDLRSTPEKAWRPGD